MISVNDRLDGHCVCWLFKRETVRSVAAGKVGYHAQFRTFSQFHKQNAAESAGILSDPDVRLTDDNLCTATTLSGKGYM